MPLKKSKNPKWRGYGLISGTLYSDLKRGAKNRNIPFKVSIEYLWELWIKQDGRCKLSGLRLTLPKNSGSSKQRTASLDRIDNEKGYEVGNLAWLHKTVNQMKYTLKQSEFIRFCKKIAENLS